MTEGTPQERRFAALARDKAMSFFAANPDVRPARGNFGVSFRNGVGELSNNSPGAACACLLTPFLLLRSASTIDRAIADLALEHGVSERFLNSLAFGWDLEEETARGLWISPSNAVGLAVRREVESLRSKR
jgi:hypothetical protein